MTNQYTTSSPVRGKSVYDMPTWDDKEKVESRKLRESGKYYQYIASQPLEIGRQASLINNKFIVLTVQRAVKNKTYSDRALNYILEAKNAIKVDYDVGNQASIEIAWDNLTFLFLAFAKIVDSFDGHTEMPKISVGDDGLDVYWRHNSSSLLINIPIGEDEKITYHAINSNRDEIMGSFSRTSPYYVNTIADWLRQEWYGR